jgi:tRNA (guanosine-2'-O-)-methyltransferase
MAKREDTAAARGLTPHDLVLEARKDRIAQVISRRTRSLVVVLDQLLDSFNMGAVARTCEGLGLQELHVIEHPEHPYRRHPGVTKGCEKWLDIHRWPDFESCRANLVGRGYALWASDLAEGALPVGQMRFEGKMALIFGNERRGVSAEALAAADGRFCIPMRGFVQSFNISVAVSATLSQAIAWRERNLGPEGDLTPEDAQELTERFTRLSVKQRAKLFPEPEGE